MNRYAIAATGLTVLLANLIGGVAPADATVGGTRDCTVNAVGAAGSGCAYPTIGVMAWNMFPGGYRARCTDRLVYNGPDKAVVLTAAHCLHGAAFDPQVGDGVNFDSQVEDDSVSGEHPRDVIPPDRVIAPDLVLAHPLSRSTQVPGVDPMGNSEPYSTADFALLVIDDPGKLAKLNSLWALPHGQLVNLPAAGYFDALSPRQLRSLPLTDVGYGADWINYGSPAGRENIGGVGNAGFRSVVHLSVTGSSATRVMTSQIQHEPGVEGTCYGDSGSSAFVTDPSGGLPTILAMPTWVDDGGTKCQSTVQWTRLDRPEALSFIACGFVPGNKEAVRACSDEAFH
jgi:hypothetical protein